MGKFKNCKVCNKVLYDGNKTGYCYRCWVNALNDEKIRKWKETGNTSCGISTTLRNCIRDYILSNQEYKCSICGIENKWNGRDLHFILDHIDGDASNNFESNLRLVCPNCDSQLDTYKSRNKNSARSHRRL